MTLDRHVREKQIRLARSLQGRGKVYLDLNYWIMAREAAAGRLSGHTELEILRLLRQGVANRQIVCPISDSFFFELEKQPKSDDRRLGTARMVDELSSGISITNMVDRVGLEIHAFFQLAVMRHQTFAVDDLMWTRVSHVLGLIDPPRPGIDPVVENEFAKWNIDALWEMPFTQFVQTVGAAPLEPSDSFIALAAETNIQRDIHADEITGFARAYEIEIAGGIGVAGVISSDLMADFAEQIGRPAPPPGSESWLACENGVKNALRRTFSKNGNARRIMRTLHIVASLHASLRNDKARRFKPNDFHDFNHAAAAIGYCDLFLTDGPLCDLARRPQLDLAAINGCRIVSNREEAVESLRAMCPAM